jgi:hypothetical protein
MNPIKMIGGLAAALLLAQAPAARAADGQGDLREIRALFLRQAAAEAAHDIATLDTVLAHASPGRPDPVSFVARAYQFWGREAVMKHFEKTFEGTWGFEPEVEAMRIIPIGPDAAQIFVPARVTFAPGGTVTTQPFLINEFAIRTAEGWRIAAIVPVPAS